MGKNEIFRSREAIQYLIEDNELAIIELNSKLSIHFKLINCLLNTQGLEVDVEPSILIEYIYENQRHKSLLEMEIIREKSNRSYLQSKAAELWQK